MKILVAADKFKGSMTGAEACAAISKGVQKVKPDVSTQQLPIADGGEGMAASITESKIG
ncbi:MAG: glycerate kinase [Verrucomicrobiota bacterium]